MPILTDKEFVKRLSDAEQGEAEAIETEIGELLSEGFTEDLAFSFVRAVMAIQKAVPGATVWGIFATALQAGLIECCRKVCDGDGLPGVKQRKPRKAMSGKRGVRGV